MKIELNLEKKYFLGILGAIFILAGIFAVYAQFNLNTPFTKTKEQAVNFGHGADEVVVDVGGVKYTLQDAITQGKLGGVTSISEVIPACTGGGTAIGDVTGCGCGGTPVCPQEYTWQGQGNGGICSSRCCTVGTAENPGGLMCRFVPIGSSCPPADCWQCTYLRYEYYPSGTCVKQ